MNRWGEQVARRDGDGVPFLVYEPRPQTLHEVLVEGLRWSGREHLVQGDVRLTFAETASAATAAAGRLSAMGVRPGDRVLLLGFNSVPWVTAFWGVLEAGAVLVLGNAWWSPDEVGHAIEVTSPAVVLASPGLRDRVRGDVPVLALDELPLQQAERSLVDLPAPSYPTGEDDPAVILFTSGSTGLPKGATLSHRACIALQHALLHQTRRLPHQVGDDHPRDVNLQTGPLFHIGGVQGLLRSWLLGATIVLTRGRFDPVEVVDLIEAERVQRWGGVTTMVSRVLDLPGVEDRDLTSLRSLTMGGSPVSPDLVARTQQAFPNAERGVSQIYGMSETGGTLTLASSRDMSARPGTAGRPLPVVELRIDNADADGIGEILARSPAQMNGYWGLPNDEIMDADGWIRTGDLGRLDDDGYLYVTGRSKDVIIRGGENVAAPHVEEELLRLDGVREVAVMGLPDPELGEVVAAVVVVDRDRSPTDLAMALQGKLARFEVPTRWWVRNQELPVNAAGKVDKPELRRQFPPDTEEA